MTPRIFIENGRRYRECTMKELELYRFWRGDCQVIVRVPQLIQGVWCFDEGPV